MTIPCATTGDFENKFVIGYSGNLGRAHEFETILAAAERLRNNSNIAFAFIGGGHLMDRLAECVNERDLSNCYFMDYQDREVLQFSLCVPDIHWISLKPQVEGLIVPSKIYGIAAAGRPVIAICAKDGEIAQMVTQHHCGVVVEPGHADALVESILRLYEDAELRAAMGVSARAMLEADFTRRQALERWTSLLQHVNYYWRLLPSSGISTMLAIDTRKSETRLQMLTRRGRSPGNISLAPYELANYKRLLY